MFIVYKLFFDDDTTYIGQTGHLNNRLDQHKSVWKKSYGLDIVRVVVLDTASGRAESLRMESAHIRADEWTKLRNKEVGLCSSADAMHLAERLAKELEPTEPLKVLNKSEFMTSDEAARYLLKKVNQLENRYISTFYELEAMKENIKDIDELVRLAISKEL